MFSTEVGVTLTEDNKIDTTCMSVTYDEQRKYVEIIHLKISRCFIIMITSVSGVVLCDRGPN